MKVLVVDDETFLAELVKLALEADGHACYAVSGTEEAAEILRSVRIDLIMLDLVAQAGHPLVWLEGIILARSDLRGRVFVLTDQPPRVEDAARLLACGARVIGKPVTLHQIREMVRLIAPVAGRPADARTGRPAAEA